MERRRFAYHEQVWAEAAMPGVEKFVVAASEAGLGLGVASSSSIGWVTEHLDRLGLLDRFAVVSCANDEVPAKPDPRVYRLAIERSASLPTPPPPSRTRRTASPRRAPPGCGASQSRTA